MNVGYAEKKVIAEVNGCTLTAVFEANHYFHRCSDGRIFNEKQGYWIREYVMTGPSGEHKLAAMFEDRRGNLHTVTDKARLLAHWRGFCGESEATFRMPRRTFKRTYFND